MRKRNLGMFLFWSGVLILLLYIFCGTVRSNIKPLKTTLVNRYEKTNIFFLKMHKCASSTVQNILMRFGYQRNLDFVLPLSGNYLGHPSKFNRSLIPLSLVSPSETYNIFAHHTRYNYPEMKAVMKKDAVFATIMRNPMEQFESLFHYYDFRSRTNMSLHDTLNTPEVWEKLATRESFRRIGVNQMSFDLGFDVEDDNLDIDELIKEVDTQFDLVMITEYMEVSLVLLCHLMNWPIEYAVSFKLNSRMATKQVILTPSEREIVEVLNAIDVQLYDYFLAKFKRRVINFGVEKMKLKVAELIELNSKWWRNCVNKRMYNGFGKTLTLEIRNNLDYTCIFMSKHELEFTDEIRDDQLRRFESLKQLDELVSSLEDEIL